MTLIIVNQENHTRLWKYKIDNRLKSHDEAIKRLLDESEQQHAKGQSD